MLTPNFTTAPSTFLERNRRLVSGQRGLEDANDDNNISP